MFKHYTIATIVKYVWKTTNVTVRYRDFGKVTTTNYTILELLLLFLIPLFRFCSIYSLLLFKLFAIPSTAKPFAQGNMTMSDHGDKILYIGTPEQNEYSMDRFSVGTPDKTKNAIAEREKICAWLKSHGVNYILPTKHQIKIGDWNFYPSTGKIYCDGHPTEAERGADAMIRILEQQRQALLDKIKTRRRGK